MRFRSPLALPLSAALLAASLVTNSVVPVRAEEQQPEQQPAVDWKLASVYGSKTPQLGTLGVRLAETVAQISGGDILLQFSEPNTIVGPSEVFEAVSTGDLEAAWSTSNYWVGRNEAFAFFSAVPFGPDAAEYGAWIYHGGGQELMDEVYAPHGIKPLICGVIAPEASGWFRNEINTVEDFQGLKIRFFGLGAKVIEKLGGEAKSIPAAEVTAALESGEIDATEFSMPAIDANLEFYKLAKHYYFPGWHQQSTLFELLVNREKWESLSDQQRAQIETACGDNFRGGMLEGEALQFSALQSFEERGVILHRWPPEILEALRSAWQEVAAEIAERNADFKKVWDSYSAFRESYRLWKDLGYVN